MREGGRSKKGEESWGVGQVGPRLSFRNPSVLDVKYGCCRLEHTFEQGFVLDEKLQLATEEQSWKRGCAASYTSGHRGVAP